METDLTFHTIEEQAAGTAIAQVKPGELDLTKIDLEAVALAKFADARAAIATATAKLSGVVHDLSTPSKLADAKSLRYRLIGTPLAEARKTSAALKSKLTAVSKVVGAELTSIEACFAAADALITPQIDAREAQLAEERRIAAEKEAARVQAHRDNLAKLAGYVEFARGLPSTRIADGIEKVKAIVIDPAAWEEFSAQAEEQKATTIERMQALLQTALVDEERARIAAEQKAEAERLAAERAEIERQKAELQAQQEAAAQAQHEREAAERAEAEAKAKKDREDAAYESWLVSTNPSGDVEAVQRQWEASPEYHELHGLTYTAPITEVQDSQQVLKAEASTPDATDRDAPAITGPSVGSMGAGQPADAGPVAAAAPTPQVRSFTAPAVSELPTMTLGQISTRLGFTVSADFLASLGFEAHKEKASRLYRPSLFPAICLAISTHVLELASEAKKAA